MNDELYSRLEKLTEHERQLRFRYLREKLGIAHPQPLAGTEPVLLSAAELDEYIELKSMLRYVD
jgi:hypothetical protein